MNSRWNFNSIDVRGFILSGAPMIAVCFGADRPRPNVLSQQAANYQTYERKRGSGGADRARHFCCVKPARPSHDASLFWIVRKWLNAECHGNSSQQSPQIPKTCGLNWLIVDTQLFEMRACPSRRNCLLKLVIVPLSATRGRQINLRMIRQLGSI
jgi:hypothetical protein